MTGWFSRVRSASPPRAAWMLGLSVQTMEALCLAAWLRWLEAMRPALDPPDSMALLVLAAATWAGACWLRRAARNLDRARILALAVAAGSILLLDPIRYGWRGWPLALPREFLDHPLSVSARVLSAWTLLWLWWRALVHVQVPLDRHRIHGLAARTVAAVAVLALVAERTRPVPLGPFVYGAAFCGLVALAGAAIRDTQRGQAAGTAELGATWRITVASWSIGVIALAVGLTALFWRGLGVQVLEASRTLWTRVESLIIAPVILLGWVGGWVSEAVARILGPDFALHLMELAQRFQRIFPAPPETPADAAKAEEGIAWLAGALRSLLFVALVVLVATLLFRALRRTGIEADPDVVMGEPEGGLSMQRLGADLRDLVARLASGARAALAGRGARRQGVRDLYARLLALLAARGTLRAPTTTPDAFLPAAEATLPAVGTHISALTTAYVRVRYGDMDPDEAQMDGLLRAWEHIRRVAREHAGGERTRP